MPLLLSLLLAAPARAAGLQSAVKTAAASLSGRAGVYAVSSGPVTAALNPDDLFPTASLIKVPILAAVIDKVEKGELDYSQPLVYHSTRAYPGEDLLAAFQDGSTVTLSRLMFLTAKMSDNTAALWLQELAGGGAGVNKWLADNGYQHTRVNSRTPGREADKKLYGWGQTTPREMARLFEEIAQGRCVSAAASAELRKILTGSFWDGEALSVLPPSAAVFSKQAAVDASRSECLGVLSGNPYVLCAFTKELKDTSYARDQEGFAFLRRVSAAVWRETNGGTPVPEVPPRYWK